MTLVGQVAGMVDMIDAPVRETFATHKKLASRVSSVMKAETQLGEQYKEVSRVLDSFNRTLLRLSEAQAQISVCEEQIDAIEKAIQRIILLQSMPRQEAAALLRRERGLDVSEHSEDAQNNDQTATTESQEPPVNADQPEITESTEVPAPPAESHEPQEAETPSTGAQMAQEE